MRFQTILIGLLLALGSFIGIYTTLTTLAAPQAYNMDVNTTFIAPFNRTLEVSEEINNKYQRVQNLSANTGSTVQIITLIPDVLSILKDLAFLPFSVIGAMINSIASLVGLPDWVILIATALVAVLFLFAIVNAILGRDS